MESTIQVFQSSIQTSTDRTETYHQQNFVLNSSVSERVYEYATSKSGETAFHYKREQDICSMESGRTTTVAEIIACVIAMLTILENGVILVAIIRGPRSLRKPPYWFIASLALADLFTGLEVILAVFIPIGSSPLSRIALKGLAVVTFIASVNSLIFVSMDRYIRIVRHVEYKRLLSRKRIVAMILFSWTTSIAIFLVAPLLGWSCGGVHCCAHDGLCACLRSKYGDDVCGAQCSQSFVPFTKWYLLIGVIYFVLSVVLMTAFYVVIFKVVKKKTFITGDKKSHGNKRRDVELAKMLVITLGIFVICWLPVVGLFVADLTITHHSDNLSKAFDFALVPSIINSFLNPIIYSIRLPNMRKTIKRLFLPCIYDESKHRPSSYVSSTSNEKRSFRRISIRRRADRKKRSKHSSTSSGAKNPSPPQPAREILLSNNSTAENTPSVSQG